MITSLDMVTHIVIDNSGTNWETIAQCFGGGHNIRVTLLGITTVSPESACSSEAALDLVEYKDGTDFCAALSQSNKELRCRYVYSSFSLDGFNNDAACCVCYQLIDSVDIVELSVPEARNHRREWSLIFWVRCCAQTSHGTAVERVVERNKLILVFVWRNRFAHFARKLNGSLVCLGTTVAYECASRASKSSGRMRELDELFREETCVRVVIEV